MLKPQSRNMTLSNIDFNERYKHIVPDLKESGSYGPFGISDLQTGSKGAIPFESVAQQQYHNISAKGFFSNNLTLFVFFVTVFTQFTTKMKEVEIKINGPFDPDFDQITEMALMIVTPLFI